MLSSSDYLIGLRQGKLNVREKKSGEQPEDLSDHGHGSYRNGYVQRTPEKC
jgi:hypothetical protein